MKYANNATKLSVKKLILAAVFCCVFSIPAFSQTTDQEEVVPTTQPASNPSTGLNTGGPWGTSAPAATGTTATRTEDGQVDGASTNANNANAAATGSGPRAGSLRNGGNVEADGRTPGGNPDVPFDPMMNVAFLVLGIAFSAFIWFKKGKLQPAFAKK